MAYLIKGVSILGAEPTDLYLTDGVLAAEPAGNAEVADSARSTIVEQVANGVAVRMAALYHLLGGNK